VVNLLPLKVIKPIEWFFLWIRREPRQGRDRRRNFDLRSSRDGKEDGDVYGNRVYNAMAKKEQEAHWT
jgi:hypothetical protein